MSRIHPGAARLLAAGLVLVTIVGAFTGTEAAEPAIVVDAPARAPDLNAGGMAVLTATVRNTGGQDGVVSMSTRAPEAVGVTMQPESFPLAAGEERTVLVTLEAPAGDQLPLGGVLMVEASLEAPDGRTATSSTPLAMTGRVPALDLSLPVLAAAGAVSAAALTGGVALIVRRRRRTRAPDATANARPVGDPDAAPVLRVIATVADTGAGALHMLSVENPSTRERVVHMGVSQKPAGWDVALGETVLTLKPGGRARVTARVTAAPGTSGRAHVTAHAEEAPERVTRVLLGAGGRRPERPLRPLTARRVTKPARSARVRRAVLTR